MKSACDSSRFLAISRRLAAICPCGWLGKSGWKRLLSDQGPNQKRGTDSNAYPLFFN